MAPLDSSGNPSAAASREQAWERAKSAATILSAIAIPVVVAIVGNSFSSAMKEREVQGKFVELAVQILREEPTKQDAGLRSWATTILNDYSGVPFSADTRNALIQHTPLPTSRYEGRTDLGNIQPGDGAKFIGRGYLHSQDAPTIQSIPSRASTSSQTRTNCRSRTSQQRCLPSGSRSASRSSATILPKTIWRRQGGWSMAAPSVCRR